MNKIIIAVIGLGYWGPNILRNLLKIPEVTKIYGCDMNPKALSRIAKDFPNVTLINSYEEILSLPEVDAVIIATPLITHFALTQMALRAKKHVLVEKPMCQTSKEAKKLISLALKNEKQLMVGHTFVYSETVKKIKQLVDKKKLGKIYYYDSTRINLGIIQKDANVIWDLAPHDLSIISYLFPEKAIAVQAFGSSFIGKTSEVAHIFVRFENNISAHIHVSWLSPVKIRAILIGGSKKMIVYNDIEPSEKLKIYDKGITPQPVSVTPFSPAYRSGDVVIPRLEQKEALYNELDHFVYCVRKNKKPLTSGAEGLQVVRLLEAIEKAFMTHKEVAL